MWLMCRKRNQKSFNDPVCRCLYSPFGSTSQVHKRFAHICQLGCTAVLIVWRCSTSYKLTCAGACVPVCMCVCVCMCAHVNSIAMSEGLLALSFTSHSFGIAVAFVYKNGQNATQCRSGRRGHVDVPRQWWQMKRFWIACATSDIS